LLDVLALNAKRGNPDASIFEIGHIFAPRRAEDVDRPVHEELWAGIALTGLRERRSWSALRERAERFDGQAAGALGATAQTSSMPRGGVSWCSPRRAPRPLRPSAGPPARGRAISKRAA